MTLYSSVTNSSTVTTTATYGVRTNVSSQNMGHIYGHRIDVNNDNISSTANTYGSRTALTSYHPGLTYGNFIVIDNYNTSSTANAYGIYADVKSSSNDNTVFGVYSKVTGGNKRWAGYFSGGDTYFSGNVGIGTTSPVMKLHVAGNTYISGNVGIGRTDPYYKLDVVGIIRAQLQVLAGQTARNFVEAKAMEYGAYMTNILNPATHTTIQKTFNYLVNDWMINSSTLWETILNLYPYGPIP